jgi:hypothetical protein
MLGRLKPKDVTADALLAGGEPVEGNFVTATTRFDYRSGEPENVVIVVSCRTGGTRHNFLFGIGGENYGEIAKLGPGDPIRLEGSGSDIMVNRMPVRKFYQRTIDGLVDLAGASWKKLKVRT